MINCLKIICFSLLFLNFPSAWSSQKCESSFNVHRREKPSGKIKLLKTCLPYMQDKHVFETDNFKIVAQTSDTPIAIDDPLRIKAATVLYHLELAHKYFREHLGETSLAHLGQSVIRLEIERSFTEVAHFTSANKPPIYNNAVSIPPSDHHRLANYKPWGYEIWFRPGKKVEIADELTQTANILGNDQLQSHAALASGAITSIGLIEDLISNGVQSVDPLSHLQTLGLSLGFIYVFPKILNVAGKLVKRYAFLETSLIPEIIYHEFTHIALANRLSPKVSTPLIEGLANYFAVKIAGSNKIAHRAGFRQNGFSARDGSKDDWYKVEYESFALAQSNFTFRLLVASEEVIGSDLAAKLIYAATENVDRGSNIKYDLIDSLFAQIPDYFPARQAPALILRLHRKFSELGL